jgi:hypothetical protein
MPYSIFFGGPAALGGGLVFTSHSPGNGKSPVLHKDGRIHIAAQTGPHKPVQTSQNGPQCIGNTERFGVCAAGKQTPT